MRDSTGTIRRCGSNCTRALPGCLFWSAVRERSCSNLKPILVQHPTRRLSMQIRWLALVPFALTLMGAEPAPDAPSLEGSWTMDSAYEILANGARTTNYGEHPSGLMIIDHAGRYSIQIFRRDRPPDRK